MAKRVRVEGELVVRDGNAKAAEFYEEEFILDDAVKTPEQARSMLHAGLITDRLRKNTDNFIRWRTCQVVDFEEVVAKVENSELDRALLEATELGCVPEGIEKYKRPDYKLKALQNAIEKHRERMAKHKKDNVKDLGYVD